MGSEHKTDVLVVSLDTFSSEGGVQRYSRRMLRTVGELVSAKALSRAAFVSLWDGPSELAADGNVPHYRSGLRPRGGRWLRLRNLVYGSIEVVRVIRRERPRYCVATHILAAVLLAPACLLRREMTFIAVVHGVEVWKSLRLPFRWVLNSLVHVVVSVSAYTEAQMKQQNPWLKKPFVVIPCAVDPLATVGPELRPGMRLLSVARLNKSDADKHVDKIIDAMPIIRASIPDAELVVVGIGDMRQELSERAERLGLSNCVFCVGRLEDRERDQLYATSQLFVLPSTREGFGIVYLEAWIGGLAVIAGNSGAAPEVVRDGIDGLCVPPDSQAIASAVVALLKNASRRKALVASGQQRARTTFSHESFRANWLRLIQACPP
jgi:phosphatidylinositol alpha-1,6-mannosyltransferase